MSVSIWQILIVVIILFPLALLPTIIAVVKNHPYKLPIILINIFGGLVFGIGWLVALVWCFIDDVPTKSSAADEIDKLYQLKQKGVLTQAEFETRKRALLNT